MFSQEDFITATRKFVCVRLESYESEEHQKMVRSFLNGRFENTAFCLLAPDGKERLSRTGRAPWMAFGGRGRPRGDASGQEASTIAAMEKAAKNYNPQGDANKPVAQDFHSFRQALNVASGDQRLLVFVVAPEAQQDRLRATFSPVMGHEKVIGRFHCDFIGKQGDEKWTDAISGEKSNNGIFVIRADTFGQKGSVLEQLPLDANPIAIRTALLRANEKFAKAEERKVYSDHVSEGRREGVFFEGGVEYGEDRDGDGKIDHRGGRGRPPRR